MGRIQVLANQLIDQIAAGEVVERPSHLLKELIENSIDAQSSQIEVRASRDLRDFTIKDNGTGIVSADLGLALQRHATSKIFAVEDLWRLQTFGFRGEALASLAAVSDLTLKSRPQTQSRGYQIRSMYGALGEVEPQAMNAGTEVSIQRLFEMLPARLKFMKSPASELASCRQVLKAVALAHPGLRLQFFVDGKLDLSFEAADQGARIKSILELREIFTNEASHQGFRVKSYFSSPYEKQKTSKNIWIFAQKRWIQDRTVVAAVLEAYRTFLMHGDYPAAALFIEAPPGEVDVNVHPTKSQVKWQDSQKVFRFVVQSIRPELEKAPWKRDRVSPALEFSDSNPSGFMASRKEPSEATPWTRSNSTANSLRVQDVFEMEPVSLQDLKAAALSRESHVLKEPELEFYEVPQKLEFEELRSEPVQTGLEPTERGYRSLRIAGQVHRTYLLCSGTTSFVMIDQHAAHERVLYERLMQQWLEKKFATQAYLVPLVVQLDEAGVEALLFMQDRLVEIGISIERLSAQSLAVLSAPLEIKERALVRLFEVIAHEVQELGESFALEEKLSDLFATMACHSAIRAGQDLSSQEMQDLLQQMDEHPQSSFCPHGRPVHIEWSWSQIEKLFGRKL